MAIFGSSWNDPIDYTQELNELKDARVLLKECRKFLRHCNDCNNYKAIELRKRITKLLNIE